MNVSYYIENRLPVMRQVCDRIAFKFYLDQDDHFQDCLIIAMRLGHNYTHQAGSDKGFLGWWYTVCRNSAINTYRKQQLVPPMVDAERAHHLPGTGNRMDNRNALAVVYRSLRLKFGTRNSLVMYLIAQQYKYEEVAEKLDIPVGTVRSIIHRCRDFLSNQNPLNMAENTVNNSDNRVKSDLTEVIPGVTKKCRGKCAQVRYVERFSKHSGNKDGLQDICKDCTSEFMRDYNARKALDRKNQLMASDIRIDPTPAAVALTPKGKEKKKELVKAHIVPKPEKKVKLPEQKMKEVTDIKPIDRTPVDRNAELHLTVAGIQMDVAERATVLISISMQREDILKKRAALDAELQRIDRLIDKLK